MQYRDHSPPREQAFRAFVCDDLGDAQYLKADYSVECNTQRHSVIILWALVAILLYPVGIPLLYAYLLFKVRDKLLNSEQSSLSFALEFLHKPFKAHLYWWELVHVSQKLVLVGFFVLVQPGSFTQLVLGMSVAVFFAAVQMQVQPYRRRADNLLATFSSLSLSSFFISCILFRFYELTADYDAVSSQLTSDWASKRFTISFGFISTVMLLSVFCGLLVMIILHTIELFAPLRTDQFLWQLDGSPVIPPDLETGQFHTFISHNWSTGQASLANSPLDCAHPRHPACCLLRIKLEPSRRNLLPSVPVSSAGLMLITCVQRRGRATPIRQALSN